MRGAARAERAEVGRTVGLRDSRDHEPGKPLGRELQVRVAPPRFRLPVETRFEPLDQAKLADRGFERAAADPVLDADGLAEELRHLAPVLGREIGTHAGAQVGCLPDVEHPAAAIAEQVDAGEPRQLRRERELGGRRVRAHCGQREKIVEPEHPERGRPLEKSMEQLGGGRGVGVRVVHRFDRGAEVARERAQLEVRYFVADEAASQCDGVDAAMGEPRIAVGDERGIEEPAVEADVVAHDHRVVRELEERRQHLGDPRGGQQHRLGDAREHRDHRRDGHARVHERLEPTEQLTAAHAQRADLGDRVGARDAPVVSRSTITKVTSASGVPRSSRVCCRGGPGGARGAGAKPESTGACGEVGATDLEDSERVFVAKVCSVSGPAAGAESTESRTGPVTIGACLLVGARALPLRRVRQSDPLRRVEHAANARVPPLQHRRRADRGGRRGARRADRGGDVPLVRRIGRLDRAGARRGVGVSSSKRATSTVASTSRWPIRCCCR